MCWFFRVIEERLLAAAVLENIRFIDVGLEHVRCIDLDA